MENEEHIQDAVQITKKAKSRSKVVATAISLYVVGIITFILLWYFILLYAPFIISNINEIIPTGESSRNTIELLKLSDQLSVAVMRWGIMPIFIGGIGDLTLYYISFDAILAIILGIWVRRTTIK